jgi:hypothetical protein
MGSLPTPPKFGNANTGPGPQQIGDWVQFWRWLWQMFRTTQNTASVTQLAGFPAPPVAAKPALDVAQAKTLQPMAPAARRDDLTALVELALAKPPYPRPQIPTVIEDTHANRTNYLAASYDKWWYFETDTLVLYLSDANAWQYVAGYYSVTQANLAAYAATLGAADAGTLAWISDYAHMLKWTGTVWTRGPGDPEHSDTFWGFGAAPGDTGWHACDGSSVNFLKYDGTLGTRTLPNAAGSACYMKVGNAYSATITAATVPTFTGASDTTSAVSAGTPAGTISTINGSSFSFTGNALSTHTHDSPINTNGSTTGLILNTGSTGGSYNTIATFTVVASVGGPFSGLETGATSAGTPTGSIGNTVTPTFTGTALGTHTHTVTPTGTISLPGDPIAWFEAISYYRQ